MKGAALLERYLREQGFVVSNPLSAPPPDDLRKAHQETLQRCDATILYWGSAPETWVTSRHSDTRKFLSARETPCLVAIYSGPPWSEAKKNFRSMDLLLIGSDSADPTALEPLILQLRPGADMK
jgi:hypothetical protein